MYHCHRCSVELKSGGNARGVMFELDMEC